MTKWLESWLLAERERWVLWLPIVLIAGMLAYFSLGREPHAASLLPLLGLPAATMFMWRRRWNARWLGLGLCLFFVGFLLAKIHTDRMDVIILEHELKFAPVTGRVIEVGDVQEGLRLTLDQVKIEDLSADKTPQRIRVTLRGAKKPIITGDTISFRAGLLPPAGPVMPGGFDFARFFFFKGIGAVGYAIPPAQVLQSESGGGSTIWLTKQREALSARIRSQMSPTEGAVAAALMMGDMASIPADVTKAMRNSNLSHILSISGLHMVIVCGWVFLAVRYLLLAIPATRHWRSGKKIAAAVGMLAGVAYLLISGLPFSAVRAYVMVALMLGAVLLDREVTPMRSLMLAAILLILFDPASVLDPSFQLSFVATASLIAWYERVQKAANEAAEKEHLIRRACIYIGGILATSLVAEIPTSPFIIYHFNSLSIYGMIANLLVSPLVSFLMMPMVICAFIAMPFGLEYWPLQLLEWGISGMIRIAEWVSSIPYAQFFVPSFPGWSMALVALGVIWLILWRRWQRLLGLVFVAVGLCGWLTIDFPDFLISKDGRQVAGRVDGELMLLQGRANSFVPKQWGNGSGVKLLPVLKGNNKNWHCDDMGCVFVMLSHDDIREQPDSGIRRGDNPIIIAIAKEQEALARDCVLASVVIARFNIDDADCSGPAIQVDRRAMMKGGAYWLWLNNGKIKMESTADVQGDRPWSGDRE